MNSGPSADSAKKGHGGGEVDFLPLARSGQDPVIDQELLQAWKDHIMEGFQNNKTLFRRVLRAFLVPYWLTVIMYVGLFVFGLAAFGFMLYLGTRQQVEVAAAFGGLSVVAFLTFFISKPLRALEQNILFITSLGVIYNTYWSQLMNAQDPKTIRADLDAITRVTISDLNGLAMRRADAAAKEPGLPAGDAPQPRNEQVGDVADQIR